MARKSTFDVISKMAESNERYADVISVTMVDNKDIFDHPKNNEDITFTSDLESSINQQGFTEPIEVTDFGMEKGKYTIVSGHRRRAAGVKCKMTVFPCIIRHFKNENEVMNALLFGNTQRDSGKGDPLLLAKRYKMHETYLKSIDFKGSFREEIANRLGLSTQQADRYAAMNKIILPIWDLIRAEKIGMSAVQPMATMEMEEQSKVYAMFIKYLESNERVSREVAGKIIKGCKKDLSYEDILTGVEKPIPNIDYPDYSGLEFEDKQEETKEQEETLNENESNFDEEINSDINSEFEDFEKDDSEKENVNEENLDIKNGKELIKLTEKISKFSEKSFAFEDNNESEIAVKTFVQCCKDILDNLFVMSTETLIDSEKINEAYQEIKEELDTYIDYNK